MAIIDEKVKEQLQTSPDGKIIVTDDMPSDLKNAIEFLNSHNISLFEDYDKPGEEIADLSFDSSFGDSDEEAFGELEPFDEAELSEDLDESETEELGKFL